jgi:DNA repair exonuclease SbcCD ATPase subunit
MFTSLDTTNFRKLTKSSFSFVSGLNAVRGQNEAGKSTGFEAMAYAMFGVDALREPLADVVTWGEKESSLKVVLRMTVNKTKIEIRRGKSGAEIDVDGKLVATGQKEVTRFVEGLLGAPPKVAAKLMLANQASLRGALSDGPTATSQLIEQLSNFALIDEVIQLVQEKLPCGAPAAYEQRLKSLSEQLESEKPGELDTRAHALEMSETVRVMAAEQEELNAAARELPAAKAAADTARGWARGLENAQASARAATQALERDRAALARLQPDSSATPEQVEALRAQVALEKDAAAAQAAHTDLLALQVPDPAWEGTRETFDKAVTQNRNASVKVQIQIGELSVRKAQVTGRLIKEQACAFCGKDLKDVPEVAQLNSKLGQELQQIEHAIGAASAVWADQQEEAEAYAAITKADQAWARVLAKHAKFVSLTDDRVPPNWAWTHQSVEMRTPGGSALLLQAAEQEMRRAAQDQGRKVELEKAVTTAMATWAEARRLTAELEPRLKGDRSTGLETDLQTKIRYHEGRINELKAAAARLAAAMDTARQLHALRVATYGRLQTSYAEALKDLEDLQLNNVLLKKLRGARPKVADKLWGTVLATVSHYFSAIRGVQSAVSRDDAGFKVDGKPVPGLSGSTLDALGLAIRIALTKTFLPNNDFLILDEPAAACDDSREANMLGVITTAGFEQVLLVTHSTLADPFADQVIEL